MLRVLIVICILFVTTTAFAGQKAITDTGAEVILNDNGTWQYKKDKAGSRIDTNQRNFTKPIDANFLLKSTRNNAAFWINTNKWQFSKSADSTSEYEFQLKDKDLYGMAVNEGVEIPIESLAEIAFGNVRDVAPDAKILKKEYRIVNGKRVIYMETSGTIQGIKCIYLGYYYSDKAGSTQYIAYTASNLVNKFEPEIADFLNGLATR